MKPVLEVCTHSVESAVSAERGGAMRLELCANLMIGGTSPDEDLFRMVRERVSVPVRVLLRPRCGDFLYTESEFELLCRQVKRFAALGADGIVIGVLTGIGNLVPYLGPIVGYGLTLVAGLSSGNVKIVIVGFIILLIIQGVDGAVVNPRLLSKNVQIHPMLVLLGVIAGNKAGGFLGMLVAVPITALLKIWFERGVQLIRERKSEPDMADMKPAPADENNRDAERKSGEKEDHHGERL